jgi:hypothetical protein
MCAWPANSADGGKLRVSVSTDSIDEDISQLLVGLG